VHHGRSPGMLYDYYGFPDETYRLSWPAPGAPELARRVDELLESAGSTVGREEKRGYDHGTFVPLMVALPNADIPTAQLSLVAGLGLFLRHGELEGHGIPSALRPRNSRFDSCLFPSNILSFEYDYPRQALVGLKPS